MPDPNLTLDRIRLTNLCQKFRRQRVLVVGDVMLDHYVIGDVRRISPEAPVQVVDYTHERYLPGGAGNVALNLVALGAAVELFGVVGKDAHAGTLRQVINRRRIKLMGLTTEAGRTTTVKMRVMAHHQQMLRIDRESRQPLAAVTRERLLRSFGSAVACATAVVVADYAKGVIDQLTMNAIFNLARKARVPVYMDPKPSRPLKLRGCALLTPNRKETFELAGLPDEPVGQQPLLHRALRRAMKIIEGKYAPATLLVTLGEHGMVVAERNGAPHHLPTLARQVYDVSGAGDTVIATFVLARSAGCEAIEAATIANMAAGLVVAKLGAAVVTPHELLNSLPE
jgi:rfaE bifunctional protein kinase chain/domain